MEKIEVQVNERITKTVFKEKDNALTMEHLNAIFGEKDREDENTKGVLLDIIRDDMEEGGGSLTLEYLEVVEVEMNYKSGKGKIYVSFNCHRWFPCDDLIREGDREDEFNFVWDKSQSNIFIDYYTPPTREPDEY